MLHGLDHLNASAGVSDSNFHLGFYSGKSFVRNLHSIHQYMFVEKKEKKWFPWRTRHQCKGKECPWSIQYLECLLSLNSRYLVPLVLGGEGVCA